MGGTVQKFSLTLFQTDKPAVVLLYWPRLGRTAWQQQHDNADMAPALCREAADAMERVADTADCMLVAADGSTYMVSKAITALHSKVLGWASTGCCTVCCTKPKCTSRFCFSSCWILHAWLQSCHMTVSCWKWHLVHHKENLHISLLPFCRAMFKDLGSEIIRIPMDDSSAAICCLVDHMYGGDMFQIDVNSLLHCSQIAHKYDMPQLQRAVDAFVRQLEYSLSDANVAHYTAIAHDTPGLQKLKEDCVEHLSKHLQRVCNLR
jgi:hypothetical protein